ncbi:MAG TPA: hypothetical protein VG452_11860 [Egibacteraceae bacterium]|nr:hypothetical protein [Egibacteraceae bacterium]
MFALLAAFCFLLALFDVQAGAINFVDLGLLLIALHLAFDIGLGRFGGMGSRRRLRR